MRMQNAEIFPSLEGFLTGSPAGGVVLYEDNHLLCAVKPPNTPAQEDSSADMDFLSVCKAYIKEKYAKPGNVYLGLVHRLDRPVGGVMIFARTSKAAARLSAMFRENGIDKRYLVVVTGEPKQSVTLMDYLAKDEKTNMVRVTREGTSGAKQARLEYTLLERRERLSLLEVKLLTGRSHQIRVQLANAGLPIYGDMRYGTQEKGHIALWCASMSFAHPVGKETVNVSYMPDFYPFNLFDWEAQDG